MSSDTLVLASVNASLPEPIDAPTLARALAHPSDPWKFHLAAFFTETPVEAIEQFAFDHRIAPAVLWESYRYVVSNLSESAPDVEDWLRDLANAPR